jgi:hypothetical protein
VKRQSSEVFFFFETELYIAGIWIHGFEDLYSKRGTIGLWFSIIMQHDTTSDVLSIDMYIVRENKNSRELFRHCHADSGDGCQQKRSGYIPGSGCNGRSTQ